MLSVTNMQPVASGGKSDVFAHPVDPALLIKVLKPKTVARALQRAGFWRGRRKRYYHLISYFRCLEEQTAALAADGRISPHLEQVVGYVETDRGVGLVVRGESHGGMLAPTLETLIREGRMDARLLRKLDDFFAWLLASPIVINDMKPVNIVLSDGRDEEECFVLVDGYGETAAIPLKSLFPALNRMTKQRKIDFMRRAMTQLPSVPRLPQAQPAALVDGRMQPATAGQVPFQPAKSPEAVPRGKPASPAIRKPLQQS